MLALTPTANLETPVMALNPGRKLEYLVRTHAGTGTTCKCHTERPQLAHGFKSAVRLQR